MFKLSILGISLATVLSAQTLGQKEEFNAVAIVNNEFGAGAGASSCASSAGRPKPSRER